METLEGRVVLVTSGGTPVGRAVALALAARGARIVVAGPEERPLGETVGEIAYGGGKARHVVGDLRDAAAVAAAVDRAVEVFGGLDACIVADDDAMSAECTLRTVAPRLRGAGRMVACGAAGAGASGALQCDVVAPSGHEPEVVAERVVARLAGA